MYSRGLGVPEDASQAVRWYRMSAAQGFSAGQYNLAVMYDRGLGVFEDLGEAIRWYRMAADQGHAGAQNSLGILYDQGRGVRADAAEALRWYRSAADQDHVEASFNLGSPLFPGAGRAEERTGGDTLVPQGGGPRPRGIPEQPGRDVRPGTGRARKHG